MYVTAKTGGPERQDLAQTELTGPFGTRCWELADSDRCQQQSGSQQWVWIVILSRGNQGGEASWRRLHLSNGKDSAPSSGPSIVRRGDTRYKGPGKEQAQHVKRGKKNIPGCLWCSNPGHSSVGSGGWWGSKGWEAAARWCWVSLTIVRSPVFIHGTVEIGRFWPRE